MNELLFHLMSPDNINRKNAEAQFSNQLESNFIITLQLLLTTFSDLNSDPILRSFSGILIRSSIEKYSTLLTSEMVIEIRNLLLTTWSSETNKLVFKRLAHMLAQLSLIGKLTDLIPTLMAISQTNKEQCLALLYFIETISDYNSDSIQINLNQLGGFLGQNIMSSDMSIQIATARATCACIVCLEDENQRNSFRAALGPIMNVIGACLTNGDETDASSIMDHLVTIANIQPVFFKGMVDQVVSAMISIANSASLEFSTQSIAVELIVTLAETAPALARRCDGLVSGLTPILFRFMTDRDESELSWVNEPYSEEITDGDYMLGEEAIERLATGIGGRMVSPEVLKFVELNSTQPTWQCRRAAVAGLHRLADGAPQYFSKSYLPMAQQLLLRMLADPSPIVQYEVLQAVGRFATIFPTEINTLIQNFVPPLVAILSNPMTCEKVKGHTVAALINLTNPDECGSEMLKPFADVLLGSLLHALQTSSVHVQSSCLILIGGVAKVIEDGFAAYYSSFMPGIKMILNQALTPDLAVLRGRAMECVGLLGEAVGADVFSADALDVMNALLGAIDLDKDSDLTFDYILPTCARISKALESRFEPFLPLVMNPLLAGANQVIQFSMTDAYEDDVEGEVSRNEETGLESTVICLGAGIKKRVTLNTTALQQKQQAARMIFEFAKSLKGHLKSYLVPCIQSLLTMITDKNSADVRSSSCLALSKIFDAFLDATKSQFVTVDTLSEVLSASLGKLLEALKGEISCTARACGAESLRDILYACYSSGVESSDGTYSGPLCLPDLEISTAIAQELLQLCGDSISRKQVKEQEFASNEGLEVEDREAFAEELEEEEDSLTNLVDAIGQLLKLHGESFMPFFDQVVSPAFAPYLSTSQPESMQVSLYMYINVYVCVYMYICSNLHITT